MEVKPGWSHPAIRRGAAVELRLGPQVVWAGLMSEPDRESREIVCQGFAREAEAYKAMNLDGAPATNVTVATQLAISRGLPWATAPLPSWPSHANPVASADTDSINTVAELWDAASEAAGRFWGVGPDRRPYARERPTAVTWHAAPGVVQLGVADDEFYTHLVGRYITLANTKATMVRGNAAAAARWGRREMEVDLFPRKAMADDQAAAILDGMLSRTGARPTFTNGFEVSRWDLTRGGVPASLPLVRAGHVVRCHGTIDPGVSPLPYHDVVIGEVRYEQDGDRIYLEPAELAKRNLTAVLEGPSGSRMAA